MSIEVFEKPRADGVTGRVARDFVYCGKRALAKSDGKTLGDEIAVLNEDGSIDRKMTFDLGRRSPLSVIGGIYTGAEFSDRQSFGISIARWNGNRYADKAQIAEWEAEDVQAERTRTLEKKRVEAEKDSEFDKLTIADVRALWTKAQIRGDYLTASAIAATASARIQKHATKVELEEYTVRQARAKKGY